MLFSLFSQTNQLASVRVQSIAVLAKFNVTQIFSRAKYYRHLTRNSISESKPQ